MELYKQPLGITKIIKQELGDNYAEMTSWQQSFLCGLLSEYKPKKILEIGVSAGGTTAVILNTLTMLNLDSTMYSVDCSKAFYRDETKETGFVSTWAADYLRQNNKVRWNHILYTGGGICNYLKTIGEGIDFLILDTMHICPGELLDFLACFPFLSDSAIVVMHDIAMQFANNSHAFATQLLLDTVVANKMVYCDESDNYHGYPNIGAFQLTNDTKKYLGNVFMSLNIPWEYQPEELELYQKWFRRYYSDDLVEIYETACINNKDLSCKKEDEIVRNMTSIAKLINDICGRSVYIYGNGKIGRRIHRILEGAGTVVLGHVVSSGESCNDGEIYIEDLKLKMNEVIVVGVGYKLMPIIQANLNKNGIYEYISLC